MCAKPIPDFDKSCADGLSSECVYGMWMPMPRCSRADFHIDAHRARFQGTVQKENVARDPRHALGDEKVARGADQRLQIAAIDQTVARLDVVEQ